MKIHPTTHCQICGRPILANTGVIALHGYKRPHKGWQTGSCFGARYKPYEQSCDAIPLAIKRAEEVLARTETSLAEWLATPPETIVFFEKQVWGKPDKSVTITKPEDFDPRDPHDYNRYRRGSYRQQYENVIHGWQQQCKEIRFDLEYLNKRLANWRAPQ